MNQELLHTFWGPSEGQHTMLQMSIRAFITFIVVLALIRLSGRRSFSMKSPFDNTLAILLGAIMAKAVIGDITYSSGLAACTVLALTHRLFGYLSLKYKGFGSWVKGEKLLLYEKGKLQEQNMVRALISENDIMERLRMNGVDSLDKIETAYMERNGEVSFIMKDQ
ncbi:MAG: DUF421 domain-containing protein [Flavipsychrobacter sp.]|nr:DUF421 domain-containing protein [Flavipsychrobacter sp.]